MLLDERGSEAAPAERLQPQGAGPGEQVQGIGAAHVVAEQVEYGLADAIFHRPGA